MQKWREQDRLVQGHIAFIVLFEELPEIDQCVSTKEECNLRLSKLQ